MQTSSLPLNEPELGYWVACRLLNERAMDFCVGRRALAGLETGAQASRGSNIETAWSVKPGFLPLDGLEMPVRVVCRAFSTPKCRVQDPFLYLAVLANDNRIVCTCYSTVESCVQTNLRQFAVCASPVIFGCAAYSMPDCSAQTAGSTLAFPASDFRQANSGLPGSASVDGT